MVRNVLVRGHAAALPSVVVTDLEVTERYRPPVGLTAYAFRP
jgi:hypothetical protein